MTNLIAYRHVVQRSWELLLPFRRDRIPSVLMMSDLVQCILPWCQSLVNMRDKHTLHGVGIWLKLEVFSLLPSSSKVEGDELLCYIDAMEMMASDSYEQALQQFDKVSQWLLYR